MRKINNKKCLNDENIYIWYDEFNLQLLDIKVTDLKPSGELRARVEVKDLFAYERPMIFSFDH